MDFPLLADVITRPYMSICLFFLVLIVVFFFRASSVDSWSKRCSADKAEERFNEYGPRGVVVRSWDASSGGTRIVGEIIIHARTTIHEVREMIRQELGVASPFLLKKCNIPLPRNIDGKRASLFVGSPEEYFVVAPSV